MKTFKSKSIRGHGLWAIPLVMLLLLSACATKQDVVQVDEKVTQVRNDQRLLRAQVNKIDSLLSGGMEQDNTLRAEIRSSIKEMNSQLSQLQSQIEDLQQIVYNISQQALTQQQRTISPPPEEVDSTEAAKETPQNTQTTSVDCRNLWENAYKDILRGEYSLAVSGFGDYLKYCPEGDMSDNSQYWIAEALYEMKQYEKAAEEYQKLIDNYPESEKIATAYFKLGRCAEETGDKKEALEYYKILRDKYPNSLEYDLVKDKIAQWESEG